MTTKTAFSNGRSAAARLPGSAGIRPGDQIRVTVVAPGKVLVELENELPQYTHFFRKRTPAGGTVTPQLVARLLREGGL